MTRRETIMSILTHKKPGKAEFSNGGGIMWDCARNNYTIADLFALPDAGAERLVNLYKEHGTAFMSLGALSTDVPIEVMGGKYTMDGIMFEVSEVPVKELEDIAKFDAQKIIADMRANKTYQDSLRQVTEGKKLVGDDGVVAVGFTAPFTAAAQLMGVQNFMENVFDDEDGEIPKLMDICIEIAAAFGKDMVEAGGDVIYTFDPVASGDMISEKMYVELVQPAMTKYVERMHEFCPVVALHICGNTAALPAHVAATGVDAISVDSIDIVKAYKDSGEKLVMMGNLNPANVLSTMSAQEVYDLSLDLCKKMAGCGGFILAPGCDPAPTIPLENFHAMRKAVDDYNATVA